MTQFTFKQMHTLINDLNQNDKGTHWFSETMPNDDTMLTAINSRPLNVSDEDAPLQLLLSTKGYFFIAHSIHDAVSDTAMNIFENFFDKYDVHACSYWLDNSFADNIYTKMINKLSCKPWEPAMFDECNRIVDETLYELKDNDKNTAQARLVISRLNEFLNHIQIVPAGDLAEATMRFSTAYPDARLILNMNAVHAYNNDNHDSLFLIVLAQYSNERVIRPIPLLSAEALQLALLGYQKHVHTPVF